MVLAQYLLVKGKMKRLSFILLLCGFCLGCFAQAIIIDGNTGTVTCNGVTRSLYEEAEDTEVASATSVSKDGIDKEHCTFTKDGKTFRLYGKVRIVDNFEDIRVRIVDNFEDVRVRLVENFEDECGRVRVVDNFEDVKVKIVDNFEDIKVRIVDNFEGVK